ncbi:substrate-binding periplasmic protein [Atopomonas sediminilitoris]|uniref:substrate-binding periplasmic protein n=1 Tax=Atopomonas sediminilitoris TaxID=2919919 RepID=UPI001F4EDBE6|nr:transporter substrate-binding domain-containing protein [Atopomonas sediminilitoris]MCJ8169034.1 transporter substrate-binding domain-containing protein [Atopomonas sediminilitoris]
MPKAFSGVIALAGWMLFAATAWSHADDEQTLVRVGGYDFPPYVKLADSSQGVSGLVPDLLAKLNALDKQWRFEFVPTSTKRRYRDLVDARFDLILFESPAWGWQKYSIHHTDLGLRDAEVYVTLNSADREQSYFDVFTGKRMALFNGYHYQFAGFNADAEFLRTQFNATLTYSHDSNLRMLERDRVDLVVVTQSFLRRFVAANPEFAGTLLVSDKHDQEYEHQVIAREQGPMTPSQLLEQMQLLDQAGLLTPLLESYGLNNSLLK